MTLDATNAEPAARHGQARLAGALYAVVAVTGTFSLGYAPSIVFAGATDAEVARSVAENAGLLRLSIVAEIACYTAFLFLPLALYRLLAPAGPFAALLMAALAMASVPFGFSYMIHALDVLKAVDAGGDGAAVVAAARERHLSGLFLQSIFWGGWLIPFGYLVIRCGFLPRILGALLILAGLGYLGHFGGRLLFAGYEESGLGPILRAPRVGEILICAWLLILGARRRPLW